VQAEFVKHYAEMLNTVIAYEKEHARRIAIKRKLMGKNEKYDPEMIEKQGDFESYGKINPENPVTQVALGPHKEFFLKLIATFDKINFYNLLML